MEDRPEPTDVTQEDRILLTEIVRRLDRESYDKDALEHVRRMLASYRIAAERKGMMEAAGIARQPRIGTDSHIREDIATAIETAAGEG